jgi:hypothetical protein
MMRNLHFTLLGCLVGAVGMAATNSSSPVTFNKDVLPILQKNCQECHRPGEVAPMSLLTYPDARPWAKAIKAAVVSKKMPPWFADDGYAHFANDKRLSDADIAKLVAWVDGGAVEGNPKDKPAPVTFTDGWNIKPDMVVEMPKDVHIQATGSMPYQNILVKVNFPDDMWVVAAEVRPGNAKVVHHIRLDVRAPGSSWMANAEPGVPYATNDETAGGKAGEGENLLGKFNPGLGAQDFSTEGAAKFIPKGSDLVFSMHYTPDGKEETDRSRVGLVFAKKKPVTRYITLNPSSNNLVIPPGDPNAEVVEEVTVTTDSARLVYVQPHMHLRGKDYEVRLIYPTGEVQTVFKGLWNFSWQQGFDYSQPIPLPKGTRIIGISHFDNSVNNPFNPDPTKEIVEGPQTWEEMSAVFLGVLIPMDTDPQKVVKKTGPSLLKTVHGAAGPTLASVDFPTTTGTK